MEAHVGGKKSQILRKRKNVNKRSDYLCFSSWVDLSYARELWKGFPMEYNGFIVLTWFHPTWMVKVTINENCYINYCIPSAGKLIFFSIQPFNLFYCSRFNSWLLLLLFLGSRSVLNEVRTSQTRNFGFISFDFP